MIEADHLCRVCGSTALQTFYRQESVPLHSALLLRDRDQAAAYPTGTIELAICRDCGFVANLAFDSELLSYDAEYDGSQAFSSTFDAFHRRLATELVDRCDLRDSTILEVGCGRGDFLRLLCALGDNRGIGYDPTAVAIETAETDDVDRVRIRRKCFPSPGEEVRADFVCCKMTLEHIAQPGPLVAAMRMATDQSARLFLQVPDASRIWRDTAFWDVYYEHCSYFDRTAVTSMLQRSGFAIDDLWYDYDDQYLLALARPTTTQPTASTETGDSIALTKQFGEAATTAQSSWRERLAARSSTGDKLVIWGAGSKAIAFLAATESARHVTCLVDVNPHKAGTFAAGSGLPIYPPDQLRDIQPAVVLAMNPIYRDEIASELAQMDATSELWTL